MLVTLAVALVGCQLLVGIPEVSLDPSAGAGAQPDADAGVADGAGDGATTPCRGTLADGGPRPGPEMVLISASAGDYCIDATEVTVAQFNAYLIASGERIDTPPVCAKALPPPLVDSDPSRADHPAGKLGSCDAWSYCRWAGKRLCGTIGDGGSVRGIDLDKTEWGFACTNGRLNSAFPYGPTYDPTACTTDSGASTPVGSMPRCHGTVAPFDRIFDLSGNAAELVNDLATIDDSVAAHGGSLKSADNSGCAAAAGFAGYVFNFDEVGFRCCASP
jgi:formylglycine-generating enzyme required for sulfatase activity